MQCLDCQLLAGQQHEFLGKTLTVELCHKAFEEKSLSTAGIPYLKVSGFSDAIQGIEELLKVTFLQMPYGTTLQSMSFREIHVVDQPTVDNLNIA